MSAAFCAFILTISALCGYRVCAAVSAVLNKPTNVRLTSHNMNLVLMWDTPVEATSGLLYTAEYKSSVTNYRVGCASISLLECDFTSLNISFSEYGKYTGRVRVDGSESSVWVESDQISLDKDTIIGSPNVSLFSNGATVEVSIKDPVFKINTFRNVYGFATYNITYWKDGQKAKATSISNIQQNRVVLNNLDIWTKYCVQVQINTDMNPNPSKPSRTVCHSTTNEKEAPWVAAVVTFVIMAMAVALVVGTVVYRKSIFYFLCPKDVLPQHFKEYLLAPPNSPVYLAMWNSHPPEEIYDQVSVITANRTVEERNPMEAAGASCSSLPDVTVHYSYAV